MMTVSDYLAVLEKYAGYYEKCSKHSDLDSFPADGALNNYNRFARDLYKYGYFSNKNKNGYNWCAIFPQACVLEACGWDVEEAKRHIPMGVYGASCTWMKKYFKQKGWLGSEPAVGAMAFIKDSSGDIYHVVNVISFNEDSITTIQGNDGKGRVSYKTYSRNSKYIDSYGYIQFDEPEIKRFEKGDKVKLNTEYYANGKHIAKSVRNREFVYVISDDGTKCKISKYASLVYTGTVLSKDVEKYGA